jgi:hypothetical protein
MVGVVAAWDQTGGAEEEEEGTGTGAVAVAAAMELEPGVEIQDCMGV